MASLKDLLIPSSDAKQIGNDPIICVVTKGKNEPNKEQANGQIEANQGGNQDENHNSDSELSEIKTESLDDIMHDTDGGTHAEDSNKAQHDANQVEIRIPRAVLCSSSKFFQSATKDEWALLRDKKQTITVAFESGLFQAYVHWLYFGTIPRLTNSSSTTPPKDSPYLAKLYVLGEEIMDFRFKNAIMDNFIAVYSGRKIFPSVEAVAIIYGATVGGSPMRRMLAEIYAYRARGSKDWKCLPKEALLDIVELMAEVRLCVKGNKPWLNVGDYHEKEKD